MRKEVLKQASIQLSKVKNEFTKRGRSVMAGAVPVAKPIDIDEPRAQLPHCAFKPKPYQGPSYDQVMRIRREHISPAVTHYFKRPLLVDQAHMQYLFDHEGKRYLDLIGAVCCVTAGHNHPRVVQAIKDQADRLILSGNIHLHPKIHEYAEKLTAKMPDHLKVVYFVNSGSEANDLAMLMARLYTGNFDVVSLRQAYHGASPFLMNITSLGTWRYNVPLGSGVLQTVNPEPFRGPWGGAHCRDSPVQTLRNCSCSPGKCEASDKYVEQLADTLRNSTPKQGGIAGFFIEGIQGAAGIQQFCKGFVKEAFDMVKEKGGVCIHDEVQTGFGRTGEHYWGFQMNGVSPDIVTMAKGIGNGLPLAAVITTPDIARTLTQALHFNTFGGNPISCAVGSTVLDIIDDENLQQRCLVVGTYFMQELAKLRDEVEIIGDVRGKGLMIGVEMVTDKETNRPLPAEDMNDIWEKMKDNGVVCGKGGQFLNVFRIQPPMCLTKGDVDFTIEVMRDVIKEHKRT